MAQGVFQDCSFPSNKFLLYFNIFEGVNTEVPNAPNPSPLQPAPFSPGIDCVCFFQKRMEKSVADHAGHYAG